MTSEPSKSKIPIVSSLNNSKALPNFTFQKLSKRLKEFNIKILKFLTNYIILQYKLA